MRKLLLGLLIVGTSAWAPPAPPPPRIIIIPPPPRLAAPRQPAPPPAPPPITSPANPMFWAIFAPIMFASYHGATRDRCRSAAENSAQRNTCKELP